MIRMLRNHWRLLLLAAIVSLSLLQNGCSSGTVSVGVGVGVMAPGPHWGGHPGRGGSVWVGRPVGRRW